MNRAVTAIAPAAGKAILPGAGFADAWRIDGLAAGTDAPTIAARFFRRSPRWIVALLRLRNFLVAPFGLRTGDGKPDGGTRQALPVVSAQPSRVVLGFDDAHLDFRVVIDVRAGTEDKLAAVATTYVRTHNIVGQLYLGAVKPFHRLIVPALLRRAAQ